MPLDLTIPDRTAMICRSAMRHCARMGWAPVAEVPIPCGRRLDVLALTGEGCLFAIEVKSCSRDFLSDNKWREYLDWCDRLFFAVDCDFPQELIPEEIGLLVTDGYEMTAIRDAPHRPLAAARRKSLVHRFAVIAAGRLAAACDPAGAQEMRAALRCE
ncbi:MmcB family DNA repair protein [Roseomonas sp. BN140053]|uniref:MmcB family DNA repair protein n=1 Tax=Roseomonas sp. BN140053 TaxID=3391898 RepID=UPI0039E9AA14